MRLLLHTIPKRRSTCKIYKSCDAVPTGKSMNRCNPAYTSKGSKNWSKCNMSHYFPGFAHYKKFCKIDTSINVYSPFHP